MIIDFDSKNKGGGGKEPVVEALNVTANGTYNAPSGVDGFTPVEVNVPQREPVLESLSVTDNGTYTPSAGKDGFDSVDVNVPKEIHNVTSKSITANGVYNSTGDEVWNSVDVNVPQKTLNKASLTKEYTANGQYSIATPDGYDGISDVNITVTVPERVPVLESLSVTENGIYNAPSNIDGYNTVSVNVPQSGGGTADYSDMQFNSGLTELDTAKYNSIQWTDLSYMFSNCGKITSLDLSSFDTSKVTNMQSMFSYCDNLATLNISGLNTANVTNMGYMFNSCRKLTTLDLSHFNTGKVTDMSSMFNYCQNITSLDVSHFDTSNVTDMSGMFRYCRNLTSLDISGWDAISVTLVGNMFYNCQSLETINCNGLKLPNINLNDIRLDFSPLTVDSIVGLLNALPTTTNGYSFKIGQTNINKLSEEQKAIATTKGWTLI